MMDKTNKIDKVTEYFVNRKRLFLERYLSEMDLSSKKSLDIGSNSGELTEFLKEKGFDSIGIDISRRLVNYARKHGTAKYFVCSVDKMQFEDNSFDLIICFDVLEHLINLSVALKEINRVLKKGGKVIFTVPNTWSYFYIRSFLTFTLKGIKPWKNVHYQHNYFYWEHQINNFLKIVDTRPILSIPFIEPKLVNKKFLSNFEYNKKKLSWLSAEPFIICTKRTKEVIGSRTTDFTKEIKMDGENE